MATISTGESSPATWSDPDDDYVDETPRRPVPKPLGTAGLLLVALLIAGAAFYGGVRVEKRYVKSSSTSTSGLAALAARARGGATGATGATGGGAAAAGAAGGATPIRGTITLVDGANVYVTDSTGNVVKVTTTPGSQISITSSGTVQKLHPGDNVTVVGPTDANGNVTASIVADTGTGTGTGAGAGFGGGRRAAGGAGGATGGAATGGAATGGGG